MRTRTRPLPLLSLIGLCALVGCGDDTTTDAGVDGSLRTDAAADSSVLDAAPQDVVSTDAGPGDPTCTEGANGFDSRPEACSERADCFDDLGCISALFAINDHEGYSPCSESIRFSSADSAAACELPLEGFDEVPESRCGEEEFSGEVTFYCAEGEDVVLMVHDMDAPSTFLGYYVWADSGFASMSSFGGDGRIDQTDGGRSRTIGYSTIDTGSGGIGPNFTATVHFTTGLIPGPEYITGGFEVMFEGEREDE
ncbi:MAG: hypothetical protein AB8H86_22200 [Polyangiales bacterium]